MIARPPWAFTGARGLYRGTTTAQCLVAAQHTVSSEAITVYNMQIGFLHPGKPNIPIEYHVEKTRDSKNFATRIFRGFQGRHNCYRDIEPCIRSWSNWERRSGAPYEHGKKMPTGLSPPDQAEMETHKVEGPFEIQTEKFLNSLLPLAILFFVQASF